MAVNHVMLPKSASLSSQLLQLDTVTAWRANGFHDDDEALMSCRLMLLIAAPCSGQNEQLRRMCSPHPIKYTARYRHYLYSLVASNNSTLNSTYAARARLLLPFLCSIHKLSKLLKTWSPFNSSLLPRSLVMASVTDPPLCRRSVYRSQFQS